MAWDKVNFVGKPEAIKRALNAYHSNLRGDDRHDFGRARYALEQLLELNSENAELHLSASEFNGVTKGVQVVLMQSNATHVQ